MKKLLVLAIAAILLIASCRQESNRPSGAQPRQGADVALSPGVEWASCWRVPTNDWAELAYGFQSIEVVSSSPVVIQAVQLGAPKDELDPVPGAVLSNKSTSGQPSTGLLLRLRVRPGSSFKGVGVRYSSDPQGGLYETSLSDFSLEAKRDCDK